MRKLIFFEGCFNPVRCPFVKDIVIPPYTIHNCTHPKIIKYHQTTQLPEDGFTGFCMLITITEEGKR